jgi:hypothetical protein
MKVYAVMGTAILFGFLMMPAVSQAAVEGTEAALFEYLEDEWLDLGTTDLRPGIKADVNGDGFPEMVYGAGYGEEPIIRIANLAGETLFEFAVYDPGMLSGFDLAVGDLNGDGKAELIAAAGPGTNGHVRIIDWLGQPVIYKDGIFPFGRDSQGGAFVGVADVIAGGPVELLIGSGAGATPQLQVWSGRYGYLGSFAPFDNDEKFGVRVAGADLNGDGRDEVVAAQAYSGGKLHVYDGLTMTQLSALEPLGEDFDGGLQIAAHHMSNPGVDGLAIAPFGENAANRPWLPQYITIDISEQRLRAYEFGREIRTFLVSTGRWDYPTPLGEFSALAKPEFVHYRWSYGEDHPENYDLGLVQWNIRFYPHVYIHYAPWHNNFGRRMSHGCVNVNRTNAEWIYGWTQVSTPITVKW